MDRHELFPLFNLIYIQKSLSFIRLLPFQGSY
jgi:hypothetical protein